MASALGDPYYTDEENPPQVPTSVLTRALGALSGTPVPATSAAPPPPEPPSGPPATLPSSVTRGLSVLGGAPVVGGPPVAGEQQPATPGLTPNVEGYRANVAPSAATSAIVAARDTGTEPVVEGQPSTIQRVAGELERVPGAAPSALEPKPAPPAAPVTPTPAAPEAPPKSEEAAAKPEETKPQRPKGHAGRPTSATTPRTESDYPPAAEKMPIDPYYLVNLEKTNPALHDSIVQAATAAGVSSGALANLVYAASNGDPNYRGKDGRVGLTGLTQEDIESFKQNPMTAPLFVGPDGQPVTTIDPATNLLLGAKKYRDMADKFGERTPAAIIANYLGDGRTAQIGSMTDPKEQAKYVTPEGANFLAKATGGPNAKPDAQTPAINPTGTMTAMGATQAFVQAAKTGEPQIAATFVANNLGRGMTPTDGWRHTEALMVAAQIAKGDMVGAQHARELVFQMSHVGTVQSLMRGLQLMGDGTPTGGDLVGAAQQFAKAYWYTPDGFMARIYVTDKGLMGERFHEASGQPVGGKFMITPQLVQGMINQTTDPQAYLKTLRDSLKLSADIDKTHAETKKLEAEVPEVKARTEHLQAQAAYQRERGGIERDRSELAADVRLLDIHRKLLNNPNDAKTLEDLEKHLDAESPRYYPEKDISGAPIPMTEERSKQVQTWRNIVKANRGTVDMSRASLIANGLVAGTIPVGEYAGSDPRFIGSGAVLNKPQNQGGVSIGVILSPTTMALLRKQTPSPPPRAPSAPAPAPAAPAR